MAAVGPEHAGRRVGVAEFQPVPAEIGAERGIGRRGDEQHEGRRHHVVDEARRGDLLGADAAADAVVALQHQHLAALAGEQRRADQRVDAAADNDVVGRAHSRRLRRRFSFFGTSASARIGLPVPCSIFSGAAIRIAPFGGSWSRLQRLARP